MKYIFIYLMCMCLSLSTRCQYIHTLAGTGVFGYNGDSIAATGARLYSPESIAFDKHKNLYVCDAMNYRIRRIDSNGIITTFAGVGSPGFNGDSIQATAALLSANVLAVDGNGNIFFVDANERIRKVDTTGIITTMCGIGISGYNGDSIPATDAMIYGGWGIVIDKEGNIIFSDQGNDRIRKIDVSTGYIYTIAGTGFTGYNGDGILATEAQIYVADGLALDTSGNLMFSDLYNYRVRKIDKISGLISTVLGTGILGYNGDGLPATATEIASVVGLIFDQNDNLFFCDAGNSRVRMVSSSDIVVHTIAGTGVRGYNGDGILATDAQVYDPSYPAISIDGNLVFSDLDNERIRTINGTVGIRNVPDENKTIGFDVYPNPATNVVNLTATQQWSSGSLITAYNLSGQQVYRKIEDFTSRRIAINTSDWMDGLYLLMIQTKGSVMYEKVVVSR